MMQKSLSPRLLIPASFLVLFALTGVARAVTITVQNINDSGPGSLRQAVRDAATLHPANETTIDFNSAVFHQTITLTGGPIIIQSKVTISGPGANLLTISGNHKSRIFTLPAGITAEIGALTLSGGFAPVESSGAGGASFPGRGGAILNSGTLLVSACALAGNSVEGSSSGDGHGGAIYNTSSLTLRRCTCNDNSAQGGGAIYNGPGGSCNLYLCTFTDNRAAFNRGGGGGAILHRGTSLTVKASTISRNSADGAGGGLYTSDVPKTTSHISSTIIGYNNAPTSPDTYGAYTSDGFNLVSVSDSGNGFTQSSDHSGTASSPLSPGLRPLADYGGPVQTMNLMHDSPAIDQGKNAGELYDQRFLPRLVDYPGVPTAAGGDSSDIGALELAANPSLNISTRLRVLTNDNALIGGFIITGTQAKKVIIRGMGPSLAGSGVQGTLADPILELHQGNSVLSVNDNWKNTQRAAIEASTLAPGDDLESAIVATLPPGAYTALLRGTNDTIGVGLIEVYDLDNALEATLANISTRGYVDTGDNAMIAGFIVGGPPYGYATIVIRGIGPSLQDFGIGNALSDPTLELHDGQGSIIQFNDNWGDVPSGEGIQDSGLRLKNDVEAGIFIPLSAGNYTVILRGKNNSTGVGVIEVYNIQRY